MRAATAWPVPVFSKSDRVHAGLNSSQPGGTAGHSHACETITSAALQSGHAASLARGFSGTYKLTGQHPVSLTIHQIRRCLQLTRPVITLAKKDPPKSTARSLKQQPKPTNDLEAAKAYALLSSRTKAGRTTCSLYFFSTFFRTAWSCEA